MVAIVTGSRLSGVDMGRFSRIRQQDITGRALDLAIPHSDSAAPLTIINQTVRYGVSRGITVNVTPFP